MSGLPTGTVTFLFTDIEGSTRLARMLGAQYRAMLAEQLHVSPEADLRALPELPTSAVPVEVDRLYRLAAASRPELQGRLAAIARAEREGRLAERIRFFCRPTLLIVDEIGYLPVVEGGGNLFF